MSSTKPTRYQFREILGSGGMGDVYAALDLKSDPPREVAIKTIRDTSNPASLELFKRECSVLMSFTHPNVIEIYETGDFDDRGASKPFFVMARLRGVTLAELIRDSPQHLTAQRTIDIVYQVCRGLQAAHEKGLVHRDIKPSNIFVLEDDSVKVIDFGVAHLVSTETIGAKGTLYYMAPEQFEGKPVTPATDVFSLGAVCFEALTRRRPFNGASADEISAQIKRHTPPPVSSLNPSVSAALSQVIHAAMAKKPLHRFDSAREFGECLKKALRNEPIERFDSAKLQLRLSRVEKALEASDYEVASEILEEIEEEGYLHPSVNELRRQVDQALRNRAIRQFLESARRFEAQEEYTLALQKVQDALQLEAANAEALELRSEIEAKRSAQQIGNWLSLAQKHLSNLAFEQAREAVSSVLHVLPTDATALWLMSEINRVEQEVVRKREEKERNYDSAVELRRKGDLTAALSRLERVLLLDREAPDPVQPERGAAFQKFYNEVRSESEAIRNAIDEAKNHLAAREYSEADRICDGFLEKYPHHALFQALKFDVGERQRQDLSAYIAEIDREVEAEPDLDRKAKILEHALGRYPDEAHFKRALKGVNAKRDLINGLVNQARNLEERGQYSEAIDKWEMLRSIYQQQPGLDFEVERLRRRLEQHTRSEAKARWIERIDAALNAGDYARALNLVQQGLVESPQDAQLLPLERLARQRVDQSQHAQSLLADAQRLLDDKLYEEAIQTLEAAHALDDHNALIRANYIEAFLGKASAVMDTDLAAAEKLIESAFGLDATNARVKNMRVLVSDRKRSTAIEQYLSRARELQATNEIARAFSEVEKGLAAYPGEARLMQLQTSLEGSLRQTELRRDRGRILDIRQRFDVSNDNGLLASLLDESVLLAKKYPRDEQIQTIATEIGDEFTRRHAPPAPPQPAEETIDGAEEESPQPVAKPDFRPAEPDPESLPVRSFRTPILVGLAAGLVLIVAIVIWPLLRPNDPSTVPSDYGTVREPKAPLPPDNAVGAAIARSTVSLVERVDSSVAVASIGVGELIDILDPLPPPSSLDEWVKVRAQSGPAGYVRLTDLDQVKTGDHRFDVWHALALIRNSTDPVEVKGRLESISLETTEPDEVYLEFSRNYARLAELDFNERSSAAAAVAEAKRYFQLITGTLRDSEDARSLAKVIQSLESRLKPPQVDLEAKRRAEEARKQRWSNWLNSAKEAYHKGTELEPGNRNGALKLYESALEYSNRILKEDPQNADALKMRDEASKSVVRIASGR